MDHESRSGSFALAVRLDRPGVQLDQVAHDRQAQTQAAVAPAYRAVLLPEAIEHMRQELCLDALTAVLHADLRHLARTRQRYFDSTAGSGELDGVGQQVAHDLLQASEVSVHQAGPGIEL